MQTSTFSIRKEQGFDVHVLQNPHLEISIIPELGAKVISLINRRTGREWMWSPPGERKLFKNNVGDDFAKSTMIGWDECIPTINACEHKGRPVPDHGEVWSLPWKVEAFEPGLITTSVRLSVFPLDFSRTIELQENRLILSYQLTNRSEEPQDYLWAMHPLIPIYPGDTIELTAEAMKILGPKEWLNTLDFKKQPDCEKAVITPLTEGRASVFNTKSGDRLTYLWDIKSHNSLGLWLTRGGWNDYHHLALEPCNCTSDDLSIAATSKTSGVLAPKETISWSVEIQIDPCFME